MKTVLTIKKTNCQQAVDLISNEQTPKWKPSAKNWIFRKYQLILQPYPAIPAIRTNMATTATAGGKRVMPERFPNHRKTGCAHDG